MENYSFDLVRIFFGEMPPIIYLEIFIRTVVLFAFMIFMLRITPQRNIGQLSPIDLLIVIALGSSVGDPMFYPEVPLLHGMMVIVIIFVFNYILSYLGFLSSDFESLIEGRPTRIINEAIMDIDKMRKANITREDVFMELRLKEYDKLGQIRHAFVETSGKISLIPYDKEDIIEDSMPTLPPRDDLDIDEKKWQDSAPIDGKYVCYSCGKVVEFKSGQTFGTCPNCDEDEWYNLQELKDAIGG